MNQSQTAATPIKATVEITVERRSCVIGKRYRDRAMSQRNSRIKLTAPMATTGARAAMAKSTKYKKKKKTKKMY
jgi:hypothetical protein